MYLTKEVKDGFTGGRQVAQQVGGRLHRLVGVRLVAAGRRFAETGHAAQKTPQVAQNALRRRRRRRRDAAGGRRHDSAG